MSWAGRNCAEWCDYHKCDQSECEDKHMSTFEMSCHFCGGPISSIDLQDPSIAVVMAEDTDGNITMAAHREPCYADEMRWLRAEARCDAEREEFK